MGYVLPNGKTRRSFQCAREVLPLLDAVRRLVAVAGVSSRPTAVGCLAYCLDAIDRYEALSGARVDFQALHLMLPSRFHVPDSFVTNGERYAVVLDASPAFFARLADFTDRLASHDYPGVRRVYTNFGIRLILRATIAIDEGFCPVVRS